ncbi:DUF1801 domain-containing protein [Georgenia thermotolerans]|uniref:DUF1801 domain-containing protein n=1 Tax=Georgenia thermotolerans TaxID=527326 RepID=A0A7J5ULA1_9MICO|nr:DUF1801 domain-containing protein [Georgenia thermotolerans]KAE8763149.1 DUF1801 domain-containing protein [Georgenia thermotolerans]
MAENLTRPTTASAADLVERAEPAGRREDARALLDLMTRVTGTAPVVWGATMIGFGEYHYRYASGHEGDTFVVGFSPRKASMSVYGLLHPDAEDLLAALGPHRRGAGCLYLGRLRGVDLAVLERLVAQAWARGGQA